MPSPSPQRFLSALWPTLVIALGALAAYHNSFNVPLLFDDYGSIVDNASIRNLGDLAAILNPPQGITVGGRPVLNFTLALNYTLSGKAVASYHVLNLLIHVGAGLALFGCVHRTLRSPALRDRFGADARPLALLAALLWTLHPLQTESVTYIVQRAESLMGLFYLLTLYGYLRSTDSPHPGRWQALAIASCALGMATKEVMVTAPLMVLLHDRAFVGGSFRGAWEQRKPLYLGLEATWAVLGWLVAAGGGNRAGSIGPGTNVSWLDYFLTQFEAVATYLKLSVWPHPLIFDYGWFQIHGLAQLAPSLLLVGPLAVLTLYALWRHPKLGFLGGWFFGILSVTSIMPGTTQLIVEHRIYLSLAAILGGLVVATHAWLGRRSWPLGLAAVVACGVLTERRNHDYRSILDLWQKTAAQRPTSLIAQCSTAQAFLNAKRAAEAIPYYERALQLAPNLIDAHIELGLALSQVGRTEEAMTHFREAMRINPAVSEPHRYLGSVLSKLGRQHEALGHLRLALQLRPDMAENYTEMGVALGRGGRLDAAIINFEQALRLDPTSATILNHLGYALMLQGRIPEARARFEEALRCDPAFSSARKNLAQIEGR